ncbi:MAG: hypothetical protein LBV44_00055 [Methylobacillus sp.]|jgi:hypothetical protein|nr:hypothetical protein [Methylobacillus sp.]
MARSVKIAALTLIAVICVIAAWNYVAVQRSASQVISEDLRNTGIKVFAHYQWFVNPRVIVFDLRQVSGNNSPLDVSRTLLQFADKLKDKQFDQIILAHKGIEKFILKGDYFHKLGAEYDFQNALYTLRTLPENAYSLDGSPAFGTWTGGWLDVFSKQMEDFNEFHKRWYLTDFAGGS